MWRIAGVVHARLLAAVMLAMLISAVAAKDLPYTVLSSEYTLPEDRARAELFRLTLEPAETTGTLAAPPTLTATVEFLGDGVCWQKYGNATDQLVLECVGGGEGLTSGSLTLLREETDRKRPHRWSATRGRRIGPQMGVVFSGSAWPPDFVLQEHLNEPYGQVDFTNAKTPEELREHQDRMAETWKEGARRYRFVGTQDKVNLAPGEWFRFQKAGTYRFRAIFFAWPKMGWNVPSNTPLDIRERVVSNIVTVHLLAKGAAEHGQPADADSDPAAAFLRDFRLGQTGR